MEREIKRLGEKKKEKKEEDETVQRKEMRNGKRE